MRQYDREQSFAGLTSIPKSKTIDGDPLAPMNSDQTAFAETPSKAPLTRKARDL